MRPASDSRAKAIVTSQGKEKAPPSAEMSGDEMVALCKKHTIFSWSAQKSLSPIPVVRAKGVYFWDAYGKRYLDFYSQLVCSNIGHGDERVIAALTAQAGRLMYVSSSMATEVRAALGRKLAALAPGDLNKVFFTMGGADANEYAVKIARAVTGRQKVVTTYRSYHGATFGASTLGGDARRLASEPGLPGVCRAFNPYSYRCRFCAGAPACTLSCLSHLEDVVQQEGPERIAAIMMETVVGGNGIIIPPDGYLRGVRELCDRHGILLILDEVLTGFGRTGKWFACQHWDVTPDLMTLAKGLTSASLPLGAVMMNDKAAAHFETNVFDGGMTYNSHPMLLAAALATLEVYEQDGLVENARKMGDVLARQLQELKANHPAVGDVRSLGLMGAIELVRDRVTRERYVPWGPDTQSTPEMNRLNAFMRELGVYTFVRWNYIFVCPPLCIDEEQLREGLAVVDRALTMADAALP
jgi:taurine---2-oxoglutarate transaminase